MTASPFLQALRDALDPGVPLLDRPRTAYSFTYIHGVIRNFQNATHNFAINPSDENRTEFRETKQELISLMEKLNSNKPRF